MSCRHSVLLAVLLALTVASAASASTFLRTDPFGTAVPAGATVTNGVGDTMFVSISGGTGMTCSSASLGMTVGASGGALVTGTLNSMTFIGCSASNGCQKAPGTTVPVTLAPTDVVLHNLYLKCMVNAGADVCYYRTPAATGTVVNGFLGAGLLFNGGVSFSHSTPSGTTDDAGAACGTTGSWATRGFTQLTTGTPGTRITVTTS